MDQIKTTSELAAFLNRKSRHSHSITTPVGSAKLITRNQRTASLATSSLKNNLQTVAQPKD
jgi:hypothetical protein